MKTNADNRGLLIFDLDGTLFRTETVTVTAVEQVLQELGLQPPTRDEVCSFFGKPVAEFQAWLRSRYPPDVAAGLPAAVRRRELELVPTAAGLYPGVREALTALRGSVSQMALCTNGWWDYVGLVLRAHRLEGFFDAVRYHQSEDDTKPGMVRELLTRLESRPAVVIGDRQDDIEAAHQNGLVAIAATYGYGSAEELKGADAYAAAPSELPGLVERLLQGEFIPRRDGTNSSVTNSVPRLST